MYCFCRVRFVYFSDVVTKAIDSVTEGIFYKVFFRETIYYLHIIMKKDSLIVIITV